MPEAKRNSIRASRADARHERGTAQPPPPDFSAFLAALQSCPVAEPAASPDRQLMDMAEQACRLARQAAALRESDLGESPGRVREWVDEWEAHGVKQRNIFRAAAKLRATTPAGIFAKATILRSTKNTAGVLGVSLARDLMESPALRRVLWPAEVV